jgi:hypothetical protein
MAFWQKVLTVAIKYINIFQSKAQQNYPNWDIWFENKPSGNPDLAASCSLHGGKSVHTDGDKKNI